MEELLRISSEVEFRYSFYKKMQRLCGLRVLLLRLSLATDLGSASPDDRPRSRRVTGFCPEGKCPKVNRVRTMSSLNHVTAACAAVPAARQNRRGLLWIDKSCDL